MYHYLKNDIVDRNSDTPDFSYKNQLLWLHHWYTTVFAGSQHIIGHFKQMTLLIPAWPASQRDQMHLPENN